MYRDTRVPGSPCPRCGETLSGAASASGAQPSPGDVSVCVYCGQLVQFGEQLEQTAMLDEEFAALPAETRLELSTIRDEIRAFWKARGFADGVGHPNIPGSRRRA